MLSNEKKGKQPDQNKKEICQNLCFYYIASKGKNLTFVARYFSYQQRL